MEPLIPVPARAWPEERRAALATAAHRTRWTRSHTERVRRALEFWYGFTVKPPTGERLRAFRSALEAMLTPSSARTYAVAAVQGLTLLLPNLGWADILSDVRGRARVRARDTAAAERDPTAAWPPEWRDRWQKARFGEGGTNRRTRLKRGHPARRWSQAYAVRVARGITRFLRWSVEHAPASDPLAAYAASLDGLAPIAAAMYVEELAVGLPVVEPDEDHADLKSLARAMKREARPRQKAARMVEYHHLADLGRTMMREADAKPFGPHAATQYRDGVMIALLAARPVRLSNLAVLRVGESLLEAPNLLLLSFATTKNGDAWTAAVPAGLEAAVRRWLERYRPVLRDRGVEDDGAVWLGLDGRALAAKSISRRIGDITLKYLGRRVNPHLFRSVLATDLCDAEEDNVAIAAAMLGQRDTRTTERHYRQARTRRAARALDDVLGAYRMPVGAVRRW